MADEEKVGTSYRGIMENNIVVLTTLIDKGQSIYYVIEDGGEGSSRFITILHRGGSPQFITILHRGVLQSLLQ